MSEVSPVGLSVVVLSMVFRRWRHLLVFLGSLIFRYQGVANDLPLAAAIALIPVAVITIYLVLVKRLGAFEAL